MRRGLKHVPEVDYLRTAAGFKPIPDEEGTETRRERALLGRIAELQTDPR